MEKYIINGGKTLKGEVVISGAKNVAVAMIPAAILADSPCTLENVPDISDVRAMIGILKKLGASVYYKAPGVLYIDGTTINSTVIPFELTSCMRASYYFIGALLGKYKTAKVASSGGCDLGKRPIDQHLKLFRALGAEVDERGGSVSANATELTGTGIFFDMVSVGATINAMLCACRAKGVTILENVAKEPHIVDIANFLNSMGAKIKGAGTDSIRITGVDKLEGTTYSIIPDQIEAGTYMVMAAATKSDITVRNVIPRHLESITAKLEEIGVGVEELDDAIRIYPTDKEYRSTVVKTMPYPGFPTDMQPIMVVLLAISKGTSTVTETVWDSRFKFTEELKKMGASIRTNGNMAYIEGIDSLTGAPVKACDLRAGAAMVIAGLMAQGTTEIYDVHHIERGYENIIDKISAIGGDIRFEK